MSHRPRRRYSRFNSDRALDRSRNYTDNFNGGQSNNNTRDRSLNNSSSSPSLHGSPPNESEMQDMFNPRNIYQWIQSEQEKYQCLKQNNEHLIEELQMEKQEKESLNMENERIRQELYESDQEHHAKCSKLRAECDRMEAQLKQDGKRLRAQLQEKDAKNKKLHGLIKQLNASKASLTKGEHEFLARERNVRGELGEMKAKLTKQKSENEDLNLKLSMKSAEVEKLQEECRKLKGTVKEISQFVNQDFIEGNIKMLAMWNDHQIKAKNALKSFMEIGGITDGSNHIGEVREGTEENSSSLTAVDVLADQRSNSDMTYYEDDTVVTNHTGDIGFGGGYINMDFTAGTGRDGKLNSFGSIIRANEGGKNEENGQTSPLEFGRATVKMEYCHDQYPSENLQQGEFSGDFLHSFGN